MKKLLLFISVGYLMISCNSQVKQNKFDWKEFVSKQADFKIKVPCELQEMVLSSQDQPKSAKTYNYWL